MGAGETVVMIGKCKTAPMGRVHASSILGGRDSATVSLLGRGRAKVPREMNGFDGVETT